MLQRIQSVYLFLAALVLALLFIFPLVHNVNTGSQIISVKITGIYTAVAGQTQRLKAFIPLTIGTVVAILLPLVVLLAYKNRKQQIMLCYGTMTVLIAYSYWASLAVKNAIDGAYLSMDNYGVGIILLSASILLVVLAQKAIQRDEKLVRSADRLR